MLYQKLRVPDYITYLGTCILYGRTPDDKQFKFGLYDDIDIKIRQRR
jgi:hypothetical protein